MTQSPANFLSAKDDVAQPAATVVVFRNDPAGGAAQILLVERSGSMAFAGGATVFPGGKVDPADVELAATLSFSLHIEDVAARIAGIREMLEETGLVVGVKGAVTAASAQAARRQLVARGRMDEVLEQFGWELDLAALVPFARWWPRHRISRIYDTRFYIADLGTGAVTLEADATENRHLFWASATEALRLADDGRIKVIFPTRRNLERLAQWGDFAACRSHAEATPITIISPEVVQRNGQAWLTIPANAGYPIDGEPLDGAERA